jgi:hypothetical protein
MVLPVSRRVPRVPRYLGTRLRSRTLVAYGALTLYRRPFLSRSAKRLVCHSSAAPQSHHVRSCNTIDTTLAGLTYRRFRLFPLRSPLLGESRLLSFPPGTEMVHFPGLATPSYGFRWRAQGLPLRGCPIRKSSGQSLFAAHRGLSQLTTSFIAGLRQGIHRTPLVA